VEPHTDEPREPDADEPGPGYGRRAAALARTSTGAGVVRVEQIVHESYSHLTFKVHLSSAPHLVAIQFPLRARESVVTSAALLGLLSEDLEVPQVLHLETGTSTALVTTWLEGRGLNQILPELSPRRQADLAHAVALTAGRIWSHRLPAPGRIGADLTIEPSRAPLAERIEAQVHSQLFDSPGGHALGPAIRGRLWALWLQVRPAVTDDLENSPKLVHGDLAPRNLIVRQDPRGAWRIAVLDWEFAVSGCPLTDIGHLLRPYDFMPAPYRHRLQEALSEADMLEPANWKALAWALDLPALTGPLVHGPGHPDNDTVTALIRSHTQLGR
jgi:aminoglycoside phosphotransferase (APT) family kinase protein